MKDISVYLTVLSVAAVLVAAMILLKRWAHRGGFQAERFAESNKPLQNPYCGFYHIFRYVLSDEPAPSDHAADDCSEALALLEINLKNYRTDEISQSGLASLDSILAAWANAPGGTKLILRFLYDWDGAALATEPDKLSLILRHIEQISEPVNRYCDTVYIMQGVLIGNWGELHTSKFYDADCVKALIQRLNEVIAPGIYLSVRTPCQWRAVNGLYDPPSAFSSCKADNTPISRLGLFNDGILGSHSDLGTYSDVLKRDAVFKAYQGTREQELAFQNKLCRYVPNGGEVIFNSVLSDLKTSVSALKAMRVSYLNADYDGRVLEKWKRSVWTANDAFYGQDGCTYVQTHLGYRYLIEACKIKNAGLSKSCTLFITVKNSGFANTLKPFEASVVLINEKTGQRTQIPLNADLRALYGGCKKTFPIKLKVPKPGRYMIYFVVKDKSSGQTILLGNTNKLTENGYLLGRLDR